MRCYGVYSWMIKQVDTRGVLTAVRALLQHLCTKVPDRAEYRTKISQVCAARCVAAKFIHMMTSLLGGLASSLPSTIQIDSCFTNTVLPSLFGEEKTKLRNVASFILQKIL